MNKLPLGFNLDNIPNLEWMLRILSWAAPSRKAEIIKKQVSVKRNQREKKLSEQNVAVDPLLA